MTDAALVTRILAGDRTAAATLVARYYDDCWRYAYRMTGRRSDADDVTQETFFRMLRALRGYQEQQRFRGWLFRILTNQCRTLLMQRRRMERHTTADALAGIASERESESEHEDETPPAQLTDVLQEALRRLPDQHREAFLLKHAEGMEYAQMADVTGASVSALKMRVKRAREVLRPMLTEYLHD